MGLFLVMESSKISASRRSPVAVDLGNSSAPSKKQPPVAVNFGNSSAFVPHYLGHEHDQRLLGKTVGHTHPCSTGCGKTLFHEHQIKSKLESETKYADKQKCGDCKPTISRQPNGPATSGALSGVRITERTRGPVVCHNCNEIGHKAAQCNQRQEYYDPCKIRENNAEGTVAKNCGTHQHKKKFKSKGDTPKEAATGALKRLLEKEVMTCTDGIMCSRPNHYHPVVVNIVNLVAGTQQAGGDLEEVEESERPTDSLGNWCDLVESSPEESDTEEREKPLEIQRIHSSVGVSINGEEESSTGSTDEPEDELLDTRAPTTSAILVVKEPVVNEVGAVVPTEEVKASIKTEETRVGYHESETNDAGTPEHATLEVKEELSNKEYHESETKITKVAEEGEGKKVVYRVSERTILIQGNAEMMYDSTLSLVAKGKLTAALCKPLESLFRSLLYTKASCLERGNLCGIDLQECSHSNLSRQHEPGFFARMFFGSDVVKDSGESTRQWRDRFKHLEYGKVLKNQLVCLELLETLITDKNLITQNPLTPNGDLAKAFFSILRFRAGESPLAAEILKREPVVYVNTVMYAHNLFLAMGLKNHSQIYLSSSNAKDF